MYPSWRFAKTCGRIAQMQMWLRSRWRETNVGKVGEVTWGELRGSGQEHLISNFIGKTRALGFPAWEKKPWRV